MNEPPDDTGYLSSGRPPGQQSDSAPGPTRTQLGDPPPGPPLGYVVPRRIRQEIDRNQPFQELPATYDDVKDGLWPTVRAENPLDVLVLPTSTTDADRSSIDTHALLLAKVWNAKLQIHRGGSGRDRIEQKYGREIDQYVDRIAWAHRQLLLDDGIEFWRRDLEEKRRERARAAMEERIELSLADKTLTPEELELLFKHAIEAGYDAEEFGKVLIIELTSREFKPTHTPMGTTTTGYLISGGRWTAGAQSVAPGGHSRRGRSAVVFFVVIVIVAMLIRVPFAGNGPFRQSIDAALGRNDAINSANSCAFDLWFDEKRSSGRTPEVMAAAEQIRRKLSPEGEELYARWYSASDPTVKWMRVTKIYNCLATLFPDNLEYALRRTYAEGQVAFENHAYGTAFTKFAKVLHDSHPRLFNQLHALALNGIGRVYEARQNDKAAEHFYEMCMHDEPEFAWSFVNRAKQHMRRGRWAEGRRVMERALLAAPYAPTILEALGNVCAELHNDREALFYYEAALRTNRDPRLVQRVAELRTKLRITIN
jgi:hypothetical protein